MFAVVVAVVAVVALVAVVAASGWVAAVAVAVVVVAAVVAVTVVGAVVVVCCYARERRVGFRKWFQLLMCAFLVLFLLRFRSCLLVSAPCCAF